MCACTGDAGAGLCGLREQNTEREISAPRPFLPVGSACIDMPMPGDSTVIYSSERQNILLTIDPFSSAALGSTRAARRQAIEIQERRQLFVMRCE